MPNLLEQADLFVANNTTSKPTTSPAGIQNPNAGNLLEAIGDSGGPLFEDSYEGFESEGEDGELPWYADMALAGAIYAGTGAVLGATTGGIGVVGTTAVAAPIYMAAKYALTGKKPKPELTSLIPGVNELSDTAQTIIGAAEEQALWMLAEPAFKGGSKAVKGLIKGVDWVKYKPVQAVADAAAPVGEWVWNKITIIPEKIKIPVPEKIGSGNYALRTKSLTETFQPAIERLEKKLPAAAEAFRRTKVESSLVTDVGRDLGRKLETETPQTIFAVGKSLKTDGLLKNIKDPKAKQLVQEFKSQIKATDLDKKYMNNFYDELTKALPTKVKISERALKVFTKPEGTSVKEIHNTLREIIHNPNSSPKQIAVAKDIWNLPARTPMAVAAASREASLDVLFAKLKSMPGVISHELKSGYVESKIKAFKGAIIHKDVELELQAMQKLPKIAEGMWQKYFMAPWKTNKVVLRPASHIRNLMSNVILNDWGGLPFYRTDIYMKAFKDMKANSTQWKEFSKLTGLSRAKFSEADINQLAPWFGGVKNYVKSIGSQTGLTYEANIMDRVMNVYDKIVAPARTLYGAEESMFKYAKYLHNIERGMAKKEAAFDAFKWTFDFSEVTPEVARIGKTLMPFVRWFSKAIPLGLETAVKHPMRFGKWIAFYQTFQAASMEHNQVDGDEWSRIKENLPDYMNKGMYLMMPFRNEEGQLNLLDMTFIVPFMGDVSQLYQSSIAENILQNPMFTISAALLSKKKYSGVPLYYEWEDPSTQFAKTMAYAWEQMMPAILPGGTDYRKLHKAFTEEEGSMSVEAALASAAGFKLTPVDEVGNIKRKEAIKKVYDKEIKSNMRKELLKSKSEDEAEDVVNKYLNYRLKIRNIEPQE